MRVIAGQVPALTDEFCSFAAQLGLSGVQVNTPSLPGRHRWEVADLVALRSRAERFGLTLEAIENIPTFFYDDVMLGGDRGDEQVAAVAQTIRHLGAAEIPVLGYCFMPNSVWRTGVGPHGRGGAKVTSYDDAVVRDPARRHEVWVARRDEHLEDVWVPGPWTGLPPATSEQMWDRHARFVETLIPVAESEGVRLALHPDDPPVGELGGIGRIFTSVDALIRAADDFDSPAWGLDLCLGTVSEMGGQDAVLRAVRELGARSKIVYVHLRDVIGTVPRFTECFLGEGNYDPLRVISELHAVGFDGFVLDDHVPQTTGDSDWMHRGRAHAIGYIQALIRAVQDADSSPAA